jgi:predicted ester cyclase
VLDEAVTAGYVYHAPGMEVSGPENMKGVFQMLRAAFPDWKETVEDLIAEGDRVVFRVTGRGTHQGEFYSIPPTGRRVSMQGIDVVRIEGNRIAEHWAVFDQLGMMQQLGVIPTSQTA